MNGQNSRSGGGVRLGFEGGQTPLVCRMPKMRGFNNPNRVVAQIISISALNAQFADDDVVDFDSLIAKKMIRKNNSKVKILGNEKIAKKLKISKDILISESAKKAVVDAGGKFL